MVITTRRTMQSDHLEFSFWLSVRQVLSWILGSNFPTPIITRTCQMHKYTKLKCANIVSRRMKEHWIPMTGVRYASRTALMSFYSENQLENILIHNTRMEFSMQLLSNQNLFQHHVTHWKWLPFLYYNVAYEAFFCRIWYFTTNLDR